MRQVNPKAQQKPPILKPAVPPSSQQPQRKALHPVTDNKQNSQGRAPENDNDLQWLQEIVNQFGVYKDLTGSKMYQHGQEDRARADGLGVSGRCPNLQSSGQSSRKESTENNRKFVAGKNLQIKHQVIHKNLANSKVNPSQASAPTIAKSKRSQSQGSHINKNRTITSMQAKPTKLSQTHKEIPYDFQICGIVDMKDDLTKMKSKLSMPNQNKIGSKVAVVRENRKQLVEALAVGKIVKNKSVQLKEVKNGGNNNKYTVEKIKIEKRNRDEIQDYLSKEMKRSMEKKQALQLSNQNQFQITVPKKEEGPKPSPVKQQPKLEEKRDNHEKTIENKQNITCVKTQNENKKYNYLIEGNYESRYEKLCNRKQRKLNSSFGQRKLLHPYPQNDISSSAKNLQVTSNFKQSPTVQKQLAKDPSPNSVPFLTQFSTNGTAPAHHRSPASQNFSSLYNKVKLVESTKNSQVFTEHSVVLDKNQLLKDNNEFLQMGAGMSKRGNEEWHIMDIFGKLDRKKIGTLSADNCSIQYVSRQIRYILGTVLEEILYRDVRYTFQQFIAKVEKTLENIKDPNQQSLSFQASNYLKTKQYAPSTRRQPQLTNPSLNGLKVSSRSRGGQAYQPVSVSTTKKYQYGKLVLNQVETEPSKKVFNDNSIRFATFQDEQITQADQTHDMGFDVDMEQLFPARTTEKYRPTHHQAIHQRLQSRLGALNQFKSTLNPKNLIPEQPTHTHQLDHNLLHNHDHEYSHSMLKIRPRSYSAVTNRQEYKNQIVKLEMLNERLEKYLHDQTMKEFSSSKLFAGEI